MSEELLNAIAVTAELTGTELSKEAARVMMQDLSTYPLDQVLGALVKCRKELKYKLTIADVISRLDDGRPGPEEAWAMIPQDESRTVVWTDEMATAFGICNPLIVQGDMIAARMAFKEAYQKAVNIARDNGVAVKWTPSLGHDKSGRDGPILDAVNRGRLSHYQAQQFLPHIENEGNSLVIS